MARKARKAAEHDALDGQHEHEHEPKLTEKKARNAVRVAKVVLPAVVPVLAPIAVKAAGAARDAYDRIHARRMGVDVEQLSEFTGRGGALLARIAGAADGLTELRRTPKVTDDDLTFAQRSQDTLTQLTASVRAAERMPGPRRKAAHKAVAAELENIEGQLLHRLGI